MSNWDSVIDDAIEKKLLTLHTAYIAKVLSFDGESATVQPLHMYKQYGKNASALAVVPNAPVIKSARFKMTSENITYVTNIVTNEIETKTIATLSPLVSGDLVLCVCCERDITEAKKGYLALPALGRHSLSDTVVVGVIS